MEGPGEAEVAMLERLRKRRETMMEYLIMKFSEWDWHGVQDAASDIRDIESEMRGVEKCVGLQKP